MDNPTNVIYDKDYYEHGVETGKSNYQNYRWIPELTIPMAMTIIDFLKIAPGEGVLDYGCAKGYLVKALRWLHREAWGFDISKYAIENADAEIKQYLTYNERSLYIRHFDYIICKDVLEHISLPDLKNLLLTLKGSKLFSVIPLGENGKYIAPANNLDKTHIICENVNWWTDLFDSCDWKCTYLSFEFTGIKESYSEFPYSHVFMVHEQ